MAPARRALRRTLRDMLQAASETALSLWHALQPPVHDDDLGQQVAALAAWEIAVAARWRLRDGATGELSPVDETAVPYGETLLHACAFAGADETSAANALLQQLIVAGGPPGLRGEASGCTPLHSVTPTLSLPP